MKGGCALGHCFEQSLRWGRGTGLAPHQPDFLKPEPVRGEKCVEFGPLLSKSTKMKSSGEPVLFLDEGWEENWVFASDTPLRKRDLDVYRCREQEDDLYQRRRVGNRVTDLQGLYTGDEGFEAVRQRCRIENSRNKVDKDKRCDVCEVGYVWDMTRENCRMDP